MLKATAQEIALRDAVVAAVLEAIHRDARIVLPAYHPEFSTPSERALLTVGVEPNPYGGTVGSYRYQFEGEDDLLHVFVVRTDGSSLTVAEGQGVLRFLLPDLPAALCWVRPGEYSQHFYFGHEELTRVCSGSASQTQA
jgi:hypothetical protein